MSVPSNVIEPSVGSSSRIIARPVVLLPQPDSPTSPSVSPFAIEKLTPSTARTSPMWRSMTISSVIGNQTFRSSTATRG